MKKLNIILETAAYWKLFIIFEILCLIMVKICYRFILPEVGWYIIGGAATLLSLFLLAAIYFARVANYLYKYCNEFEEKVHSATTREELEELLKNDFTELVKLSFTRRQSYRLKELYTIIKTKYQYL